jgi:tRNA(adenine34) deaminase
MRQRTQREIDEQFMLIALNEAQQAADAGEVPIGAVITANNKIIARGHNLTETLCDVTAHAEMQALSAAALWMGAKYIPQCTLYVTVEPCAMCAGALGWSQIGRIVYGASDPRRGFSSFTLQYTPTNNIEKKETERNLISLIQSGKTPLHPKTSITSGILADECRALIQSFFKSRR